MPSALRRPSLVAVLMTLLASLFVLAPQPAAHAYTVPVRVDQKRVELTFNTPGSTSQLTKAIKLIDGSPRGSVIRMSIYNLRVASVYNAINRARGRGVYVYIVANGENSDAPYLRALKDRMGSRFKWCWNACISNHDSGIMHAKLMMFSKTRDSEGTLRSNVVWISSANFSGSGYDYSNNSLTTYGDSTLYSGYYSDVWSPMWSSTTWSDYYDSESGRGYFGSTASNSQVYISPEAQYDLVYTRLGYVNPGRDCVIRVMHNMINDTRMAVVDRLVDFKRRGCTVRVKSHDIASAVESKFRAAGIPFQEGLKVHDKAIIIKARYDNSSSPRSVVLTGSHNLSKSALRYNDEILLKITDSTPMYDAYVNHYQSVG